MPALNLWPALKDWANMPTGEKIARGFIALLCIAVILVALPLAAFLALMLFGVFTA